MPVDYLPLHFFSWIKHGPVSANQHPLLIPETGKPQVKANADILESSDVVSGNGKLSSYSRKAQRLEMNAKNDTESKVLDTSSKFKFHPVFRHTRCHIDMKRCT